MSRFAETVKAIRSDDTGNFYIVVQTPANFVVSAFDSSGKELWTKEINPASKVLEGIVGIQNVGLGYNDASVVIDHSCSTLDNFGNPVLDDAIIVRDALVRGSYLYVLARTCEPGFPVIGGRQKSYTTYDEDLGNGNTKKHYEFRKEAVLFMLDTKSGNIVFSGYLGDYANQEPWALDIDPSGNVYVTGYTDHRPKGQYPVTSGSGITNVNVPEYSGTILVYSSPDINSAPSTSQCAHREYMNPFVIKLISSGTSYSLGKVHIFGSYCRDQAFDVVVDGNGNVYIAGETYAGGDPDYINFEPKTPSRSIANPSTSGRDVFVALLDSSLSVKGVLFLGSNGDDEVINGGIDVDSGGDVYLVGNASNGDLPLVNNKFSAPSDGSCFVVKLSKGTLSRILSTYIDPSVGITYSKGGKCYAMSVSGGTLQMVAYDGTGKGKFYVMDNSTQSTLHIIDIPDALPRLIDTDKWDNAYIGGNAGQNFSQSNPLQGGGNGDNFVGKFAFKLSLSVEIGQASTGSGKITSSPAKIDCPNTCSGMFDVGSNVTLTATPSTGSSFDRWDGDCSSCGTSLSCKISLDKDKKCIATFASAPPSNKPPLKPTIKADKSDIEPGKTVNFTCSTTDPDGDSIVQYEWTILENAPNSSPVVQNTSAEKFSYSFNREGVYDVTCKAKDDKGSWSAESDPLQINVSAQPLIKSFTADRTQGVAPLTVTFSWDVANVPQNFTNSCQLDIDGDGNYDYQNLPCSGPNAKQTHTYQNPGTYTAKLVVTDGKNKIEKSLSITVADSIIQNTPISGGCSSGGSAYAFISLILLFLKTIRRDRS